VSFSSAAGQKVTITWSNLNFGGSTDYILRKPDGTTLTSTTGFGGTSLTWSTYTLPDAGTYTILINPNGRTGSGTMSITDPSA